MWSKKVGAPVKLTNLPCGNIDPLGITGTPVIDGATRTIFADAMTTPDGGATKKRAITALSVDTGKTRPGSPIDVAAVAKSGNLSFDSAIQNQRGALVIAGGRSTCLMAGTTAIAAPTMDGWWAFRSPTPLR